MDPLIEKEIRYFIENMEYLYYKKRDINSLLVFMDDNITWIGTGKDERAHGLLEAQHALEMEVQECPDTFDILEQDVDITVLSDSLYSLYGTLHLLCHNKEIGEFYLHFTCICKHSPAGIKLIHIHFSTPDIGQKPGSYFIPENYRIEKNSLISELEEKNKQLNNLMKYMPGGVHRCASDGCFTLLDYSDGFCQMFGYSSEQIEQLFNNQYLEMIYYEDRDQVVKGIKDALEFKKSFEIEYRVLCADGSLLWILDKGILLSNKQGSSYFYCILIEINDQKKNKKL